MSPIDESSTKEENSAALINDLGGGCQRGRNGPRLEARARTARVPFWNSRMPQAPCQRTSTLHHPQIVPVVLLPEASKLVIINITADLGGPTTNRLFSMTPKDSHSSKSNSHTNRRTKLPPRGRPPPIADCDAKDILRLRRRSSELSVKIQCTSSWINQWPPRLQHWIRANPIPTMCLNAVFLSA